MTTLFDITDEELEARRRQAIFDRTQALSRGYKRPARAQAGAMFGGALTKTIFGLKSPEEETLAKRAAFQRYMASTGINMSENPEAYYAAASQAASKFGMPDVAERANGQLEALKGVRIDRNYKEKELGQRDRQIGISEEQLAEERRSNKANEGRMLSERTYKPANEDPKWAPLLEKFPEVLRNTAQVNDLGELSFRMPAGGGDIFGGGGRKTPPLKPNEVNLSPEDQLQVTSSMLNNPERVARYQKDGWFDHTGKLSPKGKLELQSVAQVARQVQINAYAGGKDSPAIGVVADRILKYKEQRPNYTYEQIGAWLVSQQQERDN